MEFEEKNFPINLKGIAKGLDISGFSIVTHYVTALLKDMCIIFQQSIHTSYG